jgi:hypothetical protein
MRRWWQELLRVRVGQQLQRQHPQGAQQVVRAVVLVALAGVRGLPVVRRKRVLYLAVVRAVLQVAQVLVLRVHQQVRVGRAVREVPARAQAVDPFAPACLLA